MKESGWDIYSWNVNGLRACGPKSFIPWMNETKAQIIGLQETKLTWETTADFVLDGYSSWFSCAQKKGYSGVALYVRDDVPVIQVSEGLGIAKFDDEGRTLIAEFDKFILFNCYFPNGQRDHNRVPFKLEYSNAVAKLALEMKAQKNKEIIIMGDYNTAHTPIDLKNPKQNEKTTGFLPIERQWMDEYFSQGFVDLFRKRHLNQEGHYTWWSYRNDCRQRNIGWRIDYVCSTEGLEKAVKETFICPEIKGSDHCPLGIKLCL